mmetsp:Transcript_35170/g.56888  ORF Transcript_35170/g.56888 Transcript_35170/m.56888 type:complete len:312 (-) Transcript_35170:274-1209(-)
MYFAIQEAVDLARQELDDEALRADENIAPTSSRERLYFKRARKPEPLQEAFPRKEEIFWKPKDSILKEQFSDRRNATEPTNPRRVGVIRERKAYDGRTLAPLFTASLPSISPLWIFASHFRWYLHVWSHKTIKDENDMTVIKGTRDGLKHMLVFQDNLGMRICCITYGLPSLRGRIFRVSRFDGSTVASLRERAVCSGEFAVYSGNATFDIFGRTSARKIYNVSGRWGTSGFCITECKGKGRVAWLTVEAGKQHKNNTKLTCTSGHDCLLLLMIALTAQTATSQFHHKLHQRMSQAVKHSSFCIGSRSTYV